MGKIKRVLDVITKEGLGTFAYLIKTNIKEKQSDARKYKQWQKHCEFPEKRRLSKENRPLVTIVLLGNQDGTASQNSLRQQSYNNFQVIEPAKNQSLKEIIRQVQGDYMGIIEKGDRLSKDALLKMALVMEESYYKEALLIYSDEDTMTVDGIRKEPFFKPDYSPDTLRSFFYMGGLLVLKKELLEKLVYSMDRPILYGGYMLALEASCYVQGNQVCHIPEVLYHRREGCGKEKPDLKSLKKEKEDLLGYYNIEAIGEEVADCREVRVVYPVTQEEKVSIIIPSKDNPAMLEQCINSIIYATKYKNYEIIIIDNGSTKENKVRYEALCKKQKVSCSYFYEPMEFNFSKMCNSGVKKATGAYYLFLNDDMEIIDTPKKDWLDRLVGQAIQPHTGAVGAKLLYPHSTLIQHVGIINYEPEAAHILSRMDDKGPMAFGRNRLDYNYSAVTGACLMVGRDKYHQTRGFCQELAVTYNDVEVCFQLLEAGYYNVVRNDVVLYHHESVTRGEDARDSEKYLRHLKEQDKLFAMHPQWVKYDSFYSRNLTQRQLDDSVNVVYRSEEALILKGKDIFSKLAKDAKVIGKIQQVKVTDKVCIRGFAFLDKGRKPDSGQTYIVLEGKKETLYVRAEKLYNPTVALVTGQEKNLNFAEFYASFSREKLEEEAYTIGILLKPFASKKVYITRSNEILKLTCEN